HMKVTRELIRQLPKTDLHLHLDGSLRPQTMIELAREYGIELPKTEPEALGNYMHVTDARNLVDYLARFDITVSLMQTAESLERIAYELVEDCAAENLRYIEVRFAPWLNTKGGLSEEEVLEAVLNGLRRGEKDFGTRSGVIVCSLRHRPANESLHSAQVAVTFKDRGVVAYDLAGPEHGHPPTQHQLAFDYAATNNLAITIHAGEAYGPASIREALHRCHARRLGHGTRLHEDPDLMNFVNDFRIPIEVCLTSNVQTKVTPDFAEHPVRLYYDQGLVVTLCTDNRLMSATTVTDEYWRAHEHLGFDAQELGEVALMGFESAFLPHAEKVALIEAVSAEIEGVIGGEMVPA
ncbi:MAG: adenosine deaminase, partial [Longimicrobiales bacterium]